LSYFFSRESNGGAPPSPLSGSTVYTESPAIRASAAGPYGYTARRPQTPTGLGLVAGQFHRARHHDLLGAFPLSTPACRWRRRTPSATLLPGYPPAAPRCRRCRWAIPPCLECCRRDQAACAGARCHRGHRRAALVLGNRQRRSCHRGRDWRAGLRVKAQQDALIAFEARDPDSAVHHDGRSVALGRFGFPRARCGRGSVRPAGCGLARRLLRWGIGILASRRPTTTQEWLARKQDALDFYVRRQSGLFAPDRPLTLSVHSVRWPCL